MILEKDKNGMTVSPCKDCIFSILDNDKPWHKNQIGCRFDRVEKFRQRGTEVEWVEGDSISANKIHIFCNMFRDSEWSREQNNPLNLLELKVRKDNQIKWDAVVWSKEVKIIEDMKKTVLNLSKQLIQPEKITIGIDNKYVDFPELVTVIRDLELKIPIFFNKILEIKYERHIIDHSLSKSSSQYYMAIKAGTEIKEDVISNLDNILNDECRIIALAKNENSSVIICNRLLHDSLNGNSEMVADGDSPISYFNIEDKLIAINPEYSNAILEL